jgi:hypothetical protein
LSSLPWRKILLLAVAAVVAAGAGAGARLVLQKEPQSVRPSAVAVSASDAVPGGAQSAIRLLLSAQGRAALTPELSASLPQGSGRLFPVGSTFTPSTGSWHQAGGFANVTGTLREPGDAPVQAEIGFVERHGGWLVTFEGTL